MANDAMMVSGGAILKKIYFSRCPIDWYPDITNRGDWQHPVLHD